MFKRIYNYAKLKNVAKSYCPIPINKFKMLKFK